MPSRRASIRARNKKSKLGLALAGGGPLGGIYEIGVLIALDEAIEGIDCNALDAYVGVSSGGFVAAALANQITPIEMYHIFIANEAGDSSLSPEIFLRPAFREYFGRAWQVPKLLLRSLWEYLRDPWERGLVESFAAMGRAIPTGLFDNRAIDKFLTKLFSQAGRTNDFRKLKQRLFLVATNLDSGESVAFGASQHAHVPISKAIQASAALPGLFPPVEIDGQHYVDGALRKTLHASVALEQGIDLLLCINPLVPFDNRAANKLNLRQLNDGGLPLVLSQTFRAVIHSRMQVGMEKYQRQFPKVDIVLFEPHRDDSDIFFANIFSYAHRQRLCNDAYQKTRQDLIARSAELESVLTRHGARLRWDVLRDSERTIKQAIAEKPMIRPLTVKQAMRQLNDTLHTLGQWLAYSSSK